MSKFVRQFAENHGGQRPREIIVAPLAAVVLSVKLSLLPTWDGVPVKLGTPADNEVAKKGAGSRLHIFLRRDYQLVACELA
jgi:hypothetical protein